MTVLFGTVEVPGLPADQNKIKVRAYGLTHPDKNDPKSTGTPLIPGPTFVFHPGDLVKLHLHNYLNRSTNPALNKFEKNPQETLPGTADDITGHASHEISIPNNADITNLHVHGLHVDPKQDNVTLLVLPEDSDPSGLIPELQRLVPTINRWWTRPYKYQIPTDHVPGTFWYHSHKHGSTATQVENGMAGALVMRPNDDQDDIVPGLWNDNPALTHDRVLVIQGIMNVGTPQGETTGPFVKQSLSSPVGTVNGQYQPTLKLPAGQLERWRLVIAGANHKAAGSFWVGQIVVATIPKLNADVIAELRKITEDKTTLAPYISKPATKTLPSFTLQCNKIPGAVKLVAVDGVPMSQFVDISPSSPTFGGAGNRNDLLIQADKEGSYYLYQNYPFTLSQDELVSQMKAAYDNDADLFVGDAGANRYAALTSQKKYNFIEVLDDKTVKAVPNNFTTDPYSLGTNYQGFKPWWANVDDNGPVNDPAPTQQSVVPLLSGDADSTPQRVDVNKKFPAFPDGLGWQPTGAGSGQPVGAAMLMKLNISGKVKPTMPTNDQLNKTLSQLSPASKNPADTKLKRLNSQGQLVPGIPSYVAQLPASFQGFDGVQVVVFDRAQFTFDYLDKKTGTTLNFRQFWLNGREFSPDDFVGNPISQQLIQSPMEDVEPSLGSYSPSGTENLWTHRVKTDQGPSLLITNPGYFRNVVAAKDSKGNSITVTDPATKKSVPAYNYDYQGVTTKPTYKNVTGLKAPKQPQSTTVEEWLLINNSDMFHPFHIHISPFFVEEIGQLNYDSNAKDPTKPWTLKNLSDSDSPFKWVANNWWDVIVLPPHGYVRMWTWINVPDQLPENTADEHSKMFVVENANVYGSWVLHCHILRHEDRGMMTMVNTTPKVTNLTSDPKSPWYTWDTSTNQATEVTIADDNGRLKVTGIQLPSVTPPKGSTENFVVTWNQGLGNPRTTQPWKGSIVNTLTDGNGNTTVALTTTFHVSSDLSEIVLSDGSIWTKTKPTEAPVPTKNLAGDNWMDGDQNVATIVQAPTPGTKGSFPLKFTSASTISGVDPVSWANDRTGIWAGGQGKPPSYAGTLNITGGWPQRLGFTVTADGNTIVFGNGIKWTRK